MRGIVDECVWSVASVAVAVSAAWIKVEPKSYAAEIVELRVVDVRRTISGLPRVKEDGRECAQGGPHGEERRGLTTATVLYE